MTDQDTQLDNETTQTDDKPQRGKAPKQDAPKTFTQEELDAYVGNARKEGRSTAVADLMKELGFEKPDDLKALVKNAKEAEEKNKTELEKALDKATKLEADLAAEKQRADTESAARLADRVNGRIEALATKAKAEYPDDVVKFLRDNHADDVKALVSEDGKIDDKAAEKLIESVKKARPTWFGVKGLGSPSNKDGRPVQPDSNQLFGNKPLVRL